MRAFSIAAMIAAAAVIASGATAQDGPRAQRQNFEDFGHVTDGGEAEGGLWLSLWQPYVRFRIGQEPEANQGQLILVIKRAREGSRAVTVRYDGTRGRLNRATGTLDYPLCAIALDDLTFEPTRRCEDKAAAAPDGPEAALTLARAHLEAGDFRRVQSLLARSDLPGDSGFRRIFLRVRAAAADLAARSAPTASPAADRESAAALADFRALALLEPDDVEHQFAIATALQDLGAYSEAEAVLSLLQAKWPDEDYRIGVRRGAVHRSRGDYAKALEELNQLVARHGPQQGMRFYYHRAWTLSLLGRTDEAIADLTEGLKAQPDYSSAYLRRACAFAAVGRLKEALDDAVEAARLYASLPGAATVKPIRDDIAELGAFRVRLEAAIAAGANKPVRDGCTGPTWRALERPRSRSPLLPAR